MECVSFPPLSRYAICCGTHGNEMTGVYMYKHLQAQKVENISVTTVLSNPRAVEACKRYTETDLNRCFTNALLSTAITDSTPYELRRAQEINAEVGPKGSDEAVDLLCDLHNTTSNMGLCVIYSTADHVAMHIFKYLKSKITSVPVRALCSDKPMSEGYSLDCVGKHGLTLEAGPQPNGVVRADVFNVVKEALEHIKEWMQQFNSGATFEGGVEDVYKTAEKVDYPRDPNTDEIAAAVHPQLQDNDFKLLRPGDPTFLSFDGETLRHKGKELYPFFINECAYYEKKVAFILGEKVSVAFPSVCVRKK